MHDHLPAPADIRARPIVHFHTCGAMSATSVTATTAFTDGNPHRKASIMLRKPGDATRRLHFAIQGMAPAVQFRQKKAWRRRHAHFPIEGRACSR
jgi:hypothetical protein